MRFLYYRKGEMIVKKYPHAKCPGHKTTNKGDMKGITITSNDGSVNVIPVLSIDAKTIVFRAKCLMPPGRIEELENELTEKIGIKCVIIGPHTELAAVIDG